MMHIGVERFKRLESILSVTYGEIHFIFDGNQGLMVLGENDYVCADQVSANEIYSDTKLKCRMNDNIVNTSLSIGGKQINFYVNFANAAPRAYGILLDGDLNSPFFNAQLRVNGEEV